MSKKSKSHKNQIKSKSHNPLMKGLKKLKYHIFEDESPIGWIFALIFMFVLLKFVIIPLLSLGLNTDFPLVAVISGSMEHRLDKSGALCGFKVIGFENNFDNWWNVCGKYYENNYNISKNDVALFSQKNGFNIGDVMFLYGTKPSKLKVGDIIVFEGGRSKPIIHRIVKISNRDGKYFFTTKGDHNAESYSFEQEIPEDKVYGRAILKIPFIGNIKIFVVNAFEKLIGLFR